MRVWMSVLWLEMILGLVPGCSLAILAWRRPFQKADVLIVVTALFATLCSTTIALLLSLAIRIGGLARHNFGLCTGYAKKTPNKPYALVPWLNDQINEIAGKPSSAPLTFGDLKAQDIDLRMMTTCFTWGRPFTMPFQNRLFYFCPKTFRSYFPEEVVAWMEAHPPQVHTPPHDLIDLKGYRPMPSDNDLPVIVATRLSLSFPVLFCAIPLAAIDFTLRRRSPNEDYIKGDTFGGSIGATEARTPEVVWFTDGGICNNFPIHLFDGPLPLWPTFGIELTTIRADRTLSEERVWLPNSNGSAMQPKFARVVSDNSFFGCLLQIGAVSMAIIDSARNWVNSLQSVVPGYRDRIVRVALTKNEGGLNFNMSYDLVTKLSEYGTDAAQRLIDHFIHGIDNGEPTTMTWDNQRWVRYRSTMSLLETFASRFARAISNPEPGDSPYMALIANGERASNAHGYGFNPGQIAAAITETEAVVALGTLMSTAPLNTGTPRPQPTLVARPDF